MTCKTGRTRKISYAIAVSEMMKLETVQSRSVIDVESGRDRVNRMIHAWVCSKEAVRHRRIKA